ncbi:NrsF family protein [Acidisoma sp. 7E03]
MSEPLPHDRLIADLSRDLKPVKRVRPTRLVLLWLFAVVLTADLFAVRADLHAMMARLMLQPYMWQAALSSAVTALLAVIAAFMTGMPGRSPRWSLLPVPALIWWLCEGGMGFAHIWRLPVLQDASMVGAEYSFGFILLVSLPLSALLALLLRRTYPLRPRLTATLAGLAASAAAATLLNFFHAYDGSLSDLVAHVASVAIVIGLNRLCARWLFR